VASVNLFWWRTRYWSWMPLNAVSVYFCIPRGADCAKRNMILIWVRHLVLELLNGACDLNPTLICRAVNIGLCNNCESFLGKYFAIWKDYYTRFNRYLYVGYKGICHVTRHRACWVACGDEHTSLSVADPGFLKEGGWLNGGGQTAPGHRPCWGLQPAVSTLFGKEEAAGPSASS